MKYRTIATHALVALLVGIGLLALVLWIMNPTHLGVGLAALMCLSYAVIRPWR